MKYTLQDYFIKTGVSQSHIARKIGVPRSMMSLYVKQKRTPSLLTALKIYEATERRIKLTSLLSEIDRAKILEWKNASE